MKHITLAGILAVLIAAAAPAIAQLHDRDAMGGHPFGQKHGKMGDHGEKLETLFEELAEYEPDITSLYNQVKESESRASRKFLYQLAREGRMVMFIGKDDTEVKELFANYTALELKSMIMADQIADTTDEQARENFKNELRGLIAQSFDIKQELRSLRLAHLENKITETRSQIDYRAANKDQIIDQRLDTLISSEEKLQW